MKFKRLLTVLVIVGLGILVYVLIQNALQKPQTAINTENSTESSTESTGQTASLEQKNGQTQEEASKTAAQTALPVSIFEIGNIQASTLNLLGTVKAQNQVRVYAQVNGQLAKVNFNAGDFVKKGEVLFELQGQNGSEHTLETQLKIAQTNYETAKRNLANTQASNASSLQVAQLQLESALDQAEGAYTDLKVFDQNIEGGEKSLTILQDSLAATRTKSTLDLEKAKRGIDDLQNAINKLNDEKYRLINTLNSQLETEQNYQPAEMTGGDNPNANAAGTFNANGSGTPTSTANATADLKTAIVQLDQKLEELYSQFESAKNGYKTLLEVSELSENQVLAQIKQAQNQAKVLELNQQSLQQKLGLDKATPSAVQLAEESVNGALVRNAVALNQAKTQLDLARLNLELAKNQTANLKVIAPTTGVLDKIALTLGDLISPQTALTQIISTDSFELETAVSIEDAAKIKVGDTAEIDLGGRFVPVPVKTIAAIADNNSKLITVTLALPKISFKANQNINARLKLYPNTQLAPDSKNFSIPLDAVIIGTEEQYVYIVQPDPTTKMPVARKTVVKLGEISGSQIQVLEGLKPSDQIIVKGAKQLIDGQTVTLEPPSL